MKNGWLATSLLAAMLIAVLIYDHRPQQPVREYIPYAVPAPPQAVPPMPKPTPAAAAVPEPATIDQAAAEPKVISRTVAFMPGQSIDIPNKRFRKVEIHSQFPIKAINATCHLEYTVEFICDGDPSDLFIADTRLRPIFKTPEGNMITITFTEF